MAKKPTPTVEALPITYQHMYDRALHTLQILRVRCNLEYALISEQYGICDATLDLTKPIAPAEKQRKQRVRSKLPYGTLTQHYMPFIKDMQPDDLVQVPCADFDAAALQASITARCCQLWGNGRVTCVTSPDKKFLEVWRLPEGLGKHDILIGSPRAETAETDD